MNNRFSLTPTPLRDAYLIERNPMVDCRGYFSRLFCSEELASAGIAMPINQINYSLTRERGTVRGLHYRLPPAAESRIISCLQGKIFDVIVDLRAGSPTFLEWHAQRLSEDNHQSFYIPQGFAHGFQALTDNCQLLYLHSGFYDSELERGLNPLEPLIQVEWPLPITKLSDRDRDQPIAGKDFSGISIT